MKTETKTSRIISEELVHNEHLNYLAETPVVSPENFENLPHDMLFLRRRQIAFTIIVNIGATWQLTR